MEVLSEGQNAMARDVTQRLEELELRSVSENSNSSYSNRVEDRISERTSELEDATLEKFWAGTDSVGQT